jgi:hypothetical protein
MSEVSPDVQVIVFVLDIRLPRQQKLGCGYGSGIEDNISLGTNSIVRSLDQRAFVNDSSGSEPDTVLLERDPGDDRAKTKVEVRRP